MQDYYKKNLEFWETAWSRVKNIYKKLPDLDYLQEMVEALKSHNVASVLDIACGSGWLSMYLSSFGFQCTGIDTSESAINLAKTWAQEDNVKNVEFFVADMMNINLQAFDAVVMNAIFEHLNYERGQEFLHKIKNLLKPNGIMFAVFDKVGTGSKGTFIMLEDGSRQYTDEMREGMLLRNYSDEELNTLLKGAGWEILSLRKNELESRVVVAKNLL